MIFKRSLLYIAVIATHFSQYCYTQWNNYSDIIIERCQNMDSDESDFMNQDDIIEYLEDLSASPININNASSEELSSLFWLFSSERNSIIDYREQYGQIMSLAELYYIPKLEGIVSSIIPFVCLEDSDTPLQNKAKEYFKYGKHEIRVQMKQKQPPSNNNTQGSPLYNMVRYRYSDGNKFSMGITGEKDQGESMFQKTNKLGYDYYSAHIQVNNLNILKTITIGDYRVRFGHGLMINQGFSLGKSTIVQNQNNIGHTLTAHKSATEYGHFRGIGAILALGKHDLTIFGSVHNLDATISTTDSMGRPISVSTIQTSGIHATDNELKHEKSEQEKALGLQYRYKTNRLELGLAGISLKYKLPIYPDPKPYNLFFFNGDLQQTATTYYTYKLGNGNLFGEFASNFKHYAFLQGFKGDIAPGTSLSLIYRYYQPGYNARYSNAFGENSENRNEEGLFAGYSWIVSKKIKLYGYVDYYNFEWLKYNIDKPSNGLDYSLQFELMPSDKIDILTKYTFKNKYQNSSNSISEILSPIYSKQLTSKLTWSPNETWKLKTNFGYRHYTKNHKTTQGIIAAQDVQLSLNTIWKIYLRACWYRTDDYYSRISLYENDLYQTFSFSSLYGHGYRFALLLSGKILKNLSIQLKTNFTKRIETIGIEALSQIEAKFQAIYTFR